MNTKVEDVLVKLTDVFARTFDQSAEGHSAVARAAESMFGHGSAVLYLFGWKPMTWFMDASQKVASPLAPLPGPQSVGITVFVHMKRLGWAGRCVAHIIGPASSATGLPLPYWMTAAAAAHDDLHMWVVAQSASSPAMLSDAACALATDHAALLAGQFDAVELADDEARALAKAGGGWDWLLRKASAPVKDARTVTPVINRHCSMEMFLQVSACVRRHAVWTLDTGTLARFVRAAVRVCASYGPAVVDAVARDTVFAAQYDEGQPLRSGVGSESTTASELPSRANFVSLFTSAELRALGLSSADGLDLLTVHRSRVVCRAQSPVHGWWVPGVVRSIQQASICDERGEIQPVQLTLPVDPGQDVCTRVVLVSCTANRPDRRL